MFSSPPRDPCRDQTVIDRVTCVSTTDSIADAPPDRQDLPQISISPSADLLPTPPSNRRRFFQQAVTGAAALGLAGQLSACKVSQAQTLSAAHFQFLHGVASGDPLQDRVIIWTRISPALHTLVDEQTSLWLRWQLAADAQMQQIIRSGVVQTSALQDFTVKVDVDGLRAGQTYYYRFVLGNEAAQENLQYSTIGRTCTLPGAEVEQVRLAVFSCANYPAGYFNVYAAAAAAAQAGEFSVALHLGDYIYEYEADGYASEMAEELGRLSEPRHALLELDDYRTRYAQYRRDADLQALHAQVPMICVWDDHEIADDTWRDGAEEHSAFIHGPFSRRCSAAMQAYHEWLPTRCEEANKIYRAFHFADILSLYMLDTRVIGRDQQLQFSSYQNMQGELDVAALRRDAQAGQRQMLGREQFAWLQQQVQTSPARWQVLGQQVLMARMEYPLSVIDDELDRFAFARLCQQAHEQGALNAQQKRQLAAPRVPCYLDSWDGYQAERERVFGLMRRTQKDLVVLTGDTHNAWAGDLQDQAGRAIGVEFATASVSSPGLERAYPDKTAQEVAQCMLNMLPSLRYAQTSQRGYLLLHANLREIQAEWRFVDTVKQRQFQTRVGGRMRVAAGRRSLEALPVT